MPLKNPSVVCVCQYASLYPPLNCSGSESTSCRIRSPQTFDVRLVEVDCCAGHKGVVVTQSAPCHLLITLTNVRYIMCVWPGTMDSWTVDGLELCSEGIRNSCSSSSSWSDTVWWTICVCIISTTTVHRRTAVRPTDSSVTAVSCNNYLRYQDFVLHLLYVTLHIGLTVPRSSDNLVCIRYMCP